MKLCYRHIIIDLPLRSLRALKQRMRWVQAAGGVVVDEAGHRLLIRRGDHWDLPKGKVEEGESPMQAAVREVKEETGVNATLQHFIVKTYHCYNLYGGWHLKQTYWYTMRAEGICPPTTPQAEEGIERAEWVEATEWTRRMKHSFGTMRIISKSLR